MEEKNRKTTESQTDNNQVKKREFQLHEHPWLSLLAVVVTTVFTAACSSERAAFDDRPLPGQCFHRFFDRLDAEHGFH
jgi:hypothetical protein